MKSTNIPATLNAYLPNNTRSYGTKTNTCKYLQVETTNLLALYAMCMPKSYRSRAYTWGEPQSLDQREGNSIYDGTFSTLILGTTVPQSLFVISYAAFCILGAVCLIS
jgi:hypothetical protein